jgi:hypothetical protein
VNPYQDFLYKAIDADASMHHDNYHDDKSDKLELAFANQLSHLAKKVAKGRPLTDDEKDLALESLENYIEYDLEDWTSPTGGTTEDFINAVKILYLSNLKEGAE